VSFQEEFYRFGKGIVADLWSTNYSAMSGITLAMPPLEEQESISKFLDCETAKIDALIAEQQRLMELLQEKRQAIISHAVTKGLNPDASMKDSGVEWLGEVPEHWEVCALSYALNAVGDVDHYMPPSVAEGVPYVMTGDLEEFASQIDLKGCKQVAHHDYEKLCKKIKTTKGDLIMARYATIGTVTYVDLDCEFLVSYSCVTIKPKTERALGMYLFFCLKSDSFVQGIAERINTNTQGNVGIADLRKVKVVLPAIAEQLEIANYLQVRVAEMGEVIESSASVISLLQERRSALISAVVTGQIDVRGIVREEVAA
jgi:type I restriction enzyme S subunit